MNNDKNPTNRDNSVTNNDESRGLNENSVYENARNDYKNDEPTVDEKDNTTNPATIKNEVDEDIRALEGGPQKHPGSSGAFPVGAFDTSKDI
ncbi:MAG: hypothetical protein ACR2KZ_05320 [Segetibacter sp.]